MDEDIPEPSLTGPLEAGGSVTNNENNKSSNLDIFAIAEEHREKSKSQQDLKRQFEEFSRNLSFRRSGRAATNKKKQNRLEISAAAGDQQRGAPGLAAAGAAPAGLLKEEPEPEPSPLIPVGSPEDGTEAAVGSITRDGEDKKSTPNLHQSEEREMEDARPEDSNPDSSPSV